MRVNLEKPLKEVVSEIARTGKRVNWARLSQRIHEVSGEKVSAATLRQRFAKVNKDQVASFLDGYVEVEPILNVPSKQVVLEITVQGRGSVGHLFEIEISSEFEEAKDLANKISMYCRHLSTEWQELNCYCLALLIVKGEPVATSADGIVSIRRL